MIVEGRILLRVQHLKQGRRGIAPEIGTQLVDLVQQEQRIGGFRLFHPLDNLARHRPDIGPTVPADFRLVADPAQRHAHEVAPRCPRDGLAERCLADTGRPHQTENRPVEFLDALLHGEVFKDAFLHLFQPVMVGVQNLFGILDVALDARALLPGNSEKPVEVITDHRGFRRHRPHGA